MTRKKRHRPRVTRKLVKVGDRKVEDSAELRVAMASEVLGNMTALFLAGWLETALFTLKEEFAFDTQQLAEFTRQFRRRWDEQKAIEPQSES